MLNSVIDSYIKRQMKLQRLLWLAASVITALQLATQPAGAYLNPVIPGFNPDPSIFRVGIKTG